MDRTQEPESLEFDVRTLQEQSNRAKKGKRRVLVGGAVFVIAFGMFFLATDFDSITSGTLSALKFATLLIVLTFVGLSLSAIVPGLLLTQDGAGRIRIDDNGLELDFSSDMILQVRWDDPKLSMELLDFSRIPQKNVLTDIRYVIRVRRNETPLSSAAFYEVLSRARRHGLAIRTFRGSLWIYPAAVAPTVYRVSALSSRGSCAR